MNRPVLSSRSRAPLTLLLTTTVLLFAACSGGGGGTPPAGPVPTPNPGGNPGPSNNGTYSANDYSYTDPNPQSYHPFAQDVYRMDRHELAVFTELYASGADGIVMDDADHGHADVAPIMPLWPTGTLVFDAAGGQLDADFGEELVAVGVYPPVSGSHWIGHVRILGTDATGALVQEAQFDFTALSGTGIVSASLDLADVDGDGRDEIVLACATGTRSAGGAQNATSNGFLLRVYDDFVGGHTLLHERVHSAGTGVSSDLDCRAATGQFDGDAAAEIVVLERYGHEIVRLAVLDDAGAGFATVHARSTEASTALQPLPATGSQFVSYSDLDVVTGNFDADDRDEFVLTVVDTYSGQTWRMGRYDDGLAGFAFVEALQYGASAEYEPYRTWRSWQLLAADLDGDGVDGLALCSGVDTGNTNSGWVFGVRYLVFGSSANAWTMPTQELQLGDGSLNYSFSRATVVRDALERRQRLVFGLIAHSGSNSRLTVHRVGREDDDGLWRMAEEEQWTRPILTSGGFPRRTLVLAGADLQGDAVSVRYTGEKYLTLADPMPICVMAAPPTKHGISQNYDDSQVAYGRSTSTSTSHTVSTSTTVSAEAGLSADFLNAFFSAEVKATYEESIEQAHGTGTAVVRTDTFVGGTEDDYIVFQGTLYRSYEYEVLTTSDPALANTRITLDVPVATKTYKWTLAYYNQTVEPRARIDRSDVLGHTIGDPTSYLTAARADSLIGGQRGWKSSLVAVGQGTRTNSAAVEITTTNSTEQSRSLGVGVSGEVQVGPLLGGGSVGIGWTSVYSIETSVGTSFEGVIGDIEDQGEYAQWAYDFAAVLFHRGGNGTGARGYQVLHFQVEPVGTGF